MPHVRIWVEADELLEDISDEVLENELKRRRENKQLSGSSNYRIPPGAAVDALNDSADQLRRSGHVNLAYKLEEIREDFIH